MYPITDPSSDTDLYRPYLCELDLALGTICRDILGLKNNTPTSLALRQNEIRDFTTLVWCYDKIDEFRYTPIGAATSQLLELGSRVTLKLFVEMCWQLRKEKGDKMPSDDELCAITSQDFLTFWTDKGRKLGPASVPATTVPQQMTREQAKLMMSKASTRHPGFIGKSSSCACSPTIRD